MLSDPIANLAELKARIMQYIHNVTPETLQSDVEHNVYQYQLVVENGGQHIKHAISNQSDNQQEFSLLFFKRFWVQEQIKIESLCIFYEVFDIRINKSRFFHHPEFSRNHAH